MFPLGIWSDSNLLLCVGAGPQRQLPVPVTWSHLARGGSHAAQHQFHAEKTEKEKHVGKMVFELHAAAPFKASLVFSSKWVRDPGADSRVQRWHPHLHSELFHPKTSPVSRAEKASPTQR